MKIKDGFVSRSVMGNEVIVPVGEGLKQFNGIVQTNETASFIVAMLKNDVTESAVVDAMLAEYDVDRATAERDVHRVIEKLRSIGVIEDT